MGQHAAAHGLDQVVRAARESRPSSGVLGLNRSTVEAWDRGFDHGREQAYGECAFDTRTAAAIVDAIVAGTRSPAPAPEETRLDRSRYPDAAGWTAASSHYAAGQCAGYITTLINIATSSRDG
jgi:hypothetical protein